MPYINIRLGATVSHKQKEQLYKKTTVLMDTIMGKRREVTVVHVQTDEPEQWAVNGTGLIQQDPISAYVEIKVTAGTNSEAQKAEMLSQTVKMLQEVIGTLQEACYVVIDDIAANSWGYNGKTQAARAAVG